jgi:hypothetical protein
MKKGFSLLAVIVFALSLFSPVGACASDASDLVQEISALPSDEGPTAFTRLVSVPSGCQPSVDTIRTQLQDYHQAAYDSNEVKAYNIYSGMRDELERLFASHDTCFEAVSDAYLLGSVAMLDWKGTRLIPLYAAFLVRKQRVELITPDVYDSYLRAINKKDSSRLMGWYDCVDDSIHLNVLLPPLNLGAAFAHELDHMFRDKYDPTVPVGTSLKSWVLYDETLATLFEGYLEFSLYSSPDEPLTIADLGKSKLNEHHYQISFDNNLFSKNGFLSKTFPWYEVRPSDYRRVMAESMLVPCFRKSGIGAFSYDGKQRKKIFALYTMVEKVYFHDQFGGLEESTLLSETPVSNDANLCDNTEPFFIFFPQGILTGFGPREISQLETFSSLLGIKTDSCKWFEDGISTDLKDYIGSKILSDPGAEGAKGDDKGAHGGAEGAKGDDKGAHGGAEGAKGDDKGAHGGAEGAKGDDKHAKGSFPLRPCLLPGKGF